MWVTPRALRSTQDHPTLLCLFLFFSWSPSLAHLTPFSAALFVWWAVTQSSSACRGSHTQRIPWVLFCTKLWVHLWTEHRYFRLLWWFYPILYFLWKASPRRKWGVVSEQHWEGGVFWQWCTQKWEPKLPFLVFSVSKARSVLAGHLTSLTGEKDEKIESRFSKPPSCLQHGAAYTASRFSRCLLMTQNGPARYFFLQPIV